MPQIKGQDEKMVIPTRVMETSKENYFDLTLCDKCDETSQSLHKIGDSVNSLDQQ